MTHESWRTNPFGVTYTHDQVLTAGGCAPGVSWVAIEAFVDPSKKVLPGALPLSEGRSVAQAVGIVDVNPVLH